MHLRPAFTILELIIALAVAIIIGAIAIPGYSSFSREQDLTGATQQIASCLQRAQREAAAPSHAEIPFGKSLRFTEATLTQDPDAGTVDCSVSLIGNDVSLADIAGGVQPAQMVAGVYSVRVGNAMLTKTVSYDYESQSKVVPDAVTPNHLKAAYIYFGALEGGKPIAYFPCDTEATCSTATGVVPKTATLGNGFTLSLQFQNASDTSFSKEVSMGRLGVPINVQ